MKKVLIIGGSIYMGICIGMCVYTIVNPEGYGTLIGKIVSGVCKGLADE